MLFHEAIAKFNQMYGLPCTKTPTTALQGNLVDRLRNFKNIMLEEFEEVDDIIYKIEAGELEIDVLTDLADWLGDIQVYCASEMARMGLPLDETLAIIMQSNFSKLGADGLPIYDERGKVLKGKSYWKPEPKLKEMLLARMPKEGRQDA